MDGTHLESIPNVAIVVIVPGKEDPSGCGKGDGGDAAQDVVVDERVELAVRSKIEELARGVVGSGRKSVAVGEESASRESDEED
jgi:hypothetical protein